MFRNKYAWHNFSYCFRLSFKMQSCTVSNNAKHEVVICRTPTVPPRFNEDVIVPRLLVYTMMSGCREASRPVEGKPNHMKMLYICVRVADLKA